MKKITEDKNLDAEIDFARGVVCVLMRLLCSLAHAAAAAPHMQNLTYVKKIL